MYYNKRKTAPGLSNEQTLGNGGGLWQHSDIRKPDNGVWSCPQYDNTEGKKTCALEIWENLDRQVPDRVVVPSGDGNILSGIWKGWRDLKAVGLISALAQ